MKRLKKLIDLKKTESIITHFRAFSSLSFFSWTFLPPNAYELEREPSLKITLWHGIFLGSGFLCKAKPTTLGVVPAFFAM